MMGKNLQEEASELAKSEQLKVKEKLSKEEQDIANERIQRRSLSWKDDHPNELLETWHEFADVKGRDIALDGGYGGGETGKSNLKAGTTLSRKPSNIVDEDDEDDDKKRCSPNSPNWGFFVAITPPSDLYPNSSTSSAAATPNPTPTASREPTPKSSEVSTKAVSNKDFEAAAAVSSNEAAASVATVPAPASDTAITTLPAGVEVAK